MLSISIKIPIFATTLYNFNLNKTDVKMEKIDNLDRKILGILSHNARIPFKECSIWWRIESSPAVDSR